jgi:hypothetical protein
MKDEELHQESTARVDEVDATEKRDLARKLDAAGWGLFFIWVGIAFLADLGVGAGLLGIGVITLGGQAARKYSNLKVEGFWAIAGLLFLVGGLWELFEAKLPLVPILLILAGVTLLISILGGKRLWGKW